MTELTSPPEWALTLANKYLKEAPGDWPLVEVLAFGLASERSRCAGVVRNYAKQFPAYPEFDESYNIAVEIANLIEAQE